MSSRYRPARPFTSFILTTVQESKLNEDTTQSFKQLLTEHQHTFAKDTMDIGFCPLMQHDIDTGDAPPIKQSPRRPALGALDAEDTILDEMLSTGVIGPSSSEWASPVCLVKKEDGTCRFCVDYRRVNAVSRRDAFPVPDIQDALDSLRSAQHFATIDLLSGYWQLGMTERAKERSAFCTRRGLFCFNRMPFELSGEPSTFCRLMSNALSDLLWRICLCYLDGIVIYTRTQAELLERIHSAVVQLVEYRSRNQEVAGSTHTLSTASNLEQVANLLCAQANSASYPQRDAK